MNRQKPCARTGDLGTGPAHRGGNIMQLKIKKDLLAVPYQVLSKGKSAAIGEFQADFIKTYRIAKAGHESFGFSRRREIERHVQFFTGGGHFLRARDGRPHHRWCELSMPDALPRALFKAESGLGPWRKICPCLGSSRSLALAAAISFFKSR